MNFPQVIEELIPVYGEDVKLFCQETDQFDTDTVSHKIILNCINQFSGSMLIYSKLF